MASYLALVGLPRLLLLTTALDPAPPAVDGLELESSAFIGNMDQACVIGTEERAIHFPSLSALATASAPSLEEEGPGKLVDLRD